MNIAATALLAQATPPQGTHDVTPVFVWLGVLLVGMIAGGLLILWLRRRMLAKSDHDAGAGLMDSIRKMRDTGQITTAEYDAMRQSMIRKTREHVASAAKNGEASRPKAR